MTTLFIDLGLDASNDDIRDQMRRMKAAREERGYRWVVCAVRGFGDDPRELWDIPEVRAFCRRLVALGFISYLDYSTHLDPRQPVCNRGAWGAAEVWLCSEGLANGGLIPVSMGLLDRIKEAVVASNAVADAALGPMA